MILHPRGIFGVIGVVLFFIIINQPKMRFIKFSFTFLFSLLLLQAVAQVYPITNGTLTTCSGVFFDDGMGDSYSNNSYTYTICPDVAGNVIQLNFTQFELWLGTSIANSDALVIYDGPDTGAPLLGSYVGNQVQFQQVTATLANTSGCLTLDFQANPNGNLDSLAAGWKADIYCVIPCSYPVAAAEITNPGVSEEFQSVIGCAGSDVSFSGVASSAQSGFELMFYSWDFGDGNTGLTGGPFITHTYEAPGTYQATLTVLDDNNCSSQPSQEMQVVIIPYPVFNLGFEPEICLNQSVLLDGGSVLATPWPILPPQQNVGTTNFSSGASNTYSTSITFDAFEPGAVVENCSDVLGAYVNMEHSFLGDLRIALSCPNGTSVNLLNHPNGGGAKYLGEAVDDPEDLPGINVPGVGYTYEWIPGSENGNVNSQPENEITYITTTGSLHTANVVPSGVYQPSDDFCAFVGCPLNGDWTLTITDNATGDDGHVFYWGLDINPYLFTGFPLVTPVIGLNEDSVLWSGTNLSEFTPDGSVVEFSPDTTGLYEFTFSGVNNFGCQQDTTFFINVIDGPVADAGSFIVICQEPGQLDGSVSGLPQPEPTCDYTIEMFDTFGDGWNGFSVTILQDGISLGTFTFTSGNASSATFTVNHGASLQINTVGGSWDTEVSYYIYNAIGDTVFFDEGSIVSGTAIVLGNNIFTGTADCLPQAPDYEYQWTPSTGLSDPNIPNPIVTVNQNTLYTLTVWQVGYPLCIGTDEVLVSVPAVVNPGVDTELSVCADAAAFSMTSALNGSPVNNGVWTDSLGIVVPVNFSPSDYPDGGSFVYTYTVSLDSCVTFSQLTINVASGLTYESGLEPVISLNFDTLFTDFQADWNYQWFWNGFQIANAQSNTYVANQNGEYTVLITDDIGCSLLVGPFNFNSLSVDENSGVQMWSAFPIPFSNELRINGSQPIEEITIWAVDGRIVYTTENGTQQSNNVQINTSGWSSGLYMVQVRGKNGTEVLKVICR